jgi:hypothetical protein
MVEQIKKCSYFTCDFCRKQHIRQFHDKIKDKHHPMKSSLKKHIKICTGERVGSGGEVKIKEVLEDMGFESKYTYLYNKTYMPMTESTGRRLKFDFRIIRDGDPLVIEYDGEFHYLPVRKYYSVTEKKAKKNLKSLQYRDKLKNKFCDENNIMMLRIPYWDFNNINSLVREFIQTYTTWKPSEI